MASKRVTLVLVASVVLALAGATRAAILGPTVLMGQAAGLPAIEVNPNTGVATGLFTRNSSGTAMAGKDISFGQNGYGYVITDTTLYEVNKNLVYTGRSMTTPGGAWLSVDVGPNGMIYAARSGQPAMEISPFGTSLAWTGRQSQYVGIDITMGTNGKYYLARSNETLLELDANMRYTGRQTTARFTSADWGADDFLYIGRSTDTAMQFNVNTWTYGLATRIANGPGLTGVDISMGPDGIAWVVRGGVSGAYQVEALTGGLLFTGTNANVSVPPANLPHVDYYVPIPEPASMALLSLGLTCLALKRRR